jgi:hypothetical protein
MNLELFAACLRELMGQLESTSGGKFNDSRVGPTAEKQVPERVGGGGETKQGSALAREVEFSRTFHYYSGQRAPEALLF